VVTKSQSDSAFAAIDASRTPPNADPLLKKPEAAGVCGCSVFTLDRWRKAGEGPPFIAVSGRIFYRLSALEAWLSRRTFSSTAEHHANDAKRAAFTERMRTVAVRQGFGKRKETP
jgi:predicted DNA-binding transcriptional regulator AlpA